MNLRTELEHVRDRSAFDPIAAAMRIWEEDQVRRDAIRDKIRGGSEGENHVNPDLLDFSRVFHISHIKKVCIAYRLRFLDAKYFKGGLPEEALTKARELEDRHETAFGEFRMMAPEKAFKLLNYNDPLLFVPIGDDHYYLVHQWGNDLSRWRKLFSWPFRHLGTFTVLCLALSVLLTMIFPVNRLGDQIPMATLIVFLFAFKSVFAVAMYGFFMGGRKFSAQAWNSVYFNG